MNDNNMNSEKRSKKNNSKNDKPSVTDKRDNKADG